MENYADASFMPNLALKQIFQQIVERTPLPFKWVSLLFKYAFNKGYLDQAIDDQLYRINNHLSHQTWLAGEVFTIADLLLWFPLQACVIAHSNIAQYPVVMRYIEHIQQRPAFQKALAKGQWDDSIFQDYWKKAW
ncbi:glutathione binding-like protein [Acinetobacter shaoyimingii]|uniref:glutathione binding-like protein n=1 Tax=Acinetobacter shaoyimingii TaxID=2715164 RepID=UPI001D0E4722|nr:glutathione binding-like protein [Acinetobacter shaoyimingii]